RDRRIFAVLREHDRRLELPQQRDEFGYAKAVVPHLDDMTEVAAVELARQQFEKLAEIAFVEFLGRRELPEHRTEPIAEFEHAGVVEALDGITGFRQHAAVGGEARSLQREHEAVRHLTGPFAKALRLLRTVVCPV